MIFLLSFRTFKNLPSFNQAFIYKPSEFSLGHDSILKIETTVLIQMWLSQTYKVKITCNYIHLHKSYLVMYGWIKHTFCQVITQCIQKPEVLIISIMILSCTQRVCHIFNTVYNRTGKVISGIHSVKQVKINLITMFLIRNR